MILLAVVAVVLLAGGYLTLRSYLHGDGFRKFLSTKVSRAADVEGKFSSFRWNGLSVDTDSFDAAGDGPLVRLKAEGLHTEIGLGGVGRGVWELNGTSVARLDAEIIAGKDLDENIPPEVKAPMTKKERPKRWYPSEVELKGFEVREANIDATLRSGDLLSMEGISVRAAAGSVEKSYIAEIEGGTLRLPEKAWPEIAIKRVKAGYQNRVLSVTSAEAEIGDGGRLLAAGRWDAGAKSYDFRGRVSDVGLEQLLRKNWAKRIAGKVSSSFTVEGRPGTGMAEGSLEITDAVISTLRVLEVLSAYTGTRSFHELRLSEARADWTWSKEESTLGKLVLESEGLIRLEGGMTLRGEDLEGEFLLGLAPTVLSVLPGAERNVFVPGEKGLLWTKVRVSGTVDHPREDLSERLIAAAGLRIFEELPGGKKALRFSRDLLGDQPEERIQNGIEAYEKAEDAVRETRDLLKGIFRKESDRERRRK